MATYQAFKVQHTVPGQSWKFNQTFVKAESQEAAILKYKQQRESDPAAVITAEPVKLFPTTEKITVDSYPYGRLRTTAFFSVEFKKGKGFRQVFQTINPKNGRLNAPKNGTYSDILFLYQGENGHIHGGGYSLNGAEYLNKFFHFYADFSEIFTDEQKENIFLTCLAMLKIDAKAKVIYTGANWDDIKQYYDTPLKQLVKLAKKESEDITPCFIDVNAIKAHEVPGYNPFTVTTYEMRGTSPEAAI